MTNASLPGGAIQLTYTAQAGDTTSTIATAFANGINSNGSLSGAGITATWRNLS